ncbi:flagellar basal body L-ring protein FlgH [Sphingomonas naphthae]|uniref:Flagellar L-ring protein n=1 Tax=Sphingomonas naphthae TaxID=1813468 RepID=A0ABY7TML0_9SPHN|nr:flagellar basal body L-ring protein FlgH [Sphingomonas naphthae]WCT73645.1 flagellar basal body L-ring protein FlgH [Sphingomonas naphthae]
MNRTALLAALVLVSAPALAVRQPKVKPNWDPTPPAMPASPVANGAIFQVANGYAPLTSGARAAMVGDIVTIILAEKTAATKSNTASTDRNGSISVTPPATGPLSLFVPTDVGMGAGGKFKGVGGAAQSNQLNGEISVTVAQVFPNGTMLVRGEKIMNLNRGEEHIRIAGIIRAADISFDNRILSTRVADAQITYSGTGEIARASRQGWLGRFFSKISPF